MTDRYEKIRAALAMGPTPGPWELRDGRTDTVENAQGYPVCTVNYHPDERYGHGTRAAYIAAYDPDTIAALLKERDALARENEALKRCAIMYLGWLGVTHIPLDQALHSDMRNPSVCGDAALSKENSND